jgi:hypothetical protein
LCFSILCVCVCGSAFRVAAAAALNIAFFG